MAHFLVALLIRYSTHEETAGETNPEIESPRQTAIYCCPAESLPHSRQNFLTLLFYMYNHCLLNSMLSACRAFKMKCYENNLPRDVKSIVFSPPYSYVKFPFVIRLFHANARNHSPRI